MSKAKKTFKGGYRFKHFKGSPMDTIVNLDAPDTVTVPLWQERSPAIEPSVKEGDEVRVGQVIGTGPVHSPVDGKVSGISKLPGLSALVIDTAPGFVLKKDDVIKLEGASKGWRKLDVNKIEELIYLSGAASLDRSGIPTRFNSSPIGPDEVGHLIVRIVEDELLPASDSALLSESGIDTFTDACRILKKVFPRAQMTIAVSENLKEVISHIKSSLMPDDEISAVTVSDKYPQGFEEVLVPTLTGGSFPYGFNAVNLGVVVLGVQTILSVHQAVTAGMPVLTRVIALGGTGFLENLHVRVPIGTAWNVITNKYGDTSGEQRLVQNSLLTGQALVDPELPVMKTDSALYAVPEMRTTELMPFASPGFSKDSYSNTFPTFLLPLKKKLDTNIHGEGRACLSCSFCSDVCPVGILPALLHRYVLRDIIDEPMKQFGIFRCVDCNLCTYVCPSKIPVAELIKKGKQLLIKEGLGNEDETKLNFSLKGI